MFQKHVESFNEINKPKILPANKGKIIGIFIITINTPVFLVKYEMSATINTGKNWYFVFR